MKNIAGRRLKSLRQSRYLSQIDVATYGDFKLSSNYRYYENKHQDEFLPQRIREQIFRALLGRGTPPIKEHELLDLFYPLSDSRILYPGGNNRAPRVQEYHQHNTADHEEEKSVDLIGIDDLIHKAFSPLTEHEVETLTTDGQIMKGHGLKYGQIFPIEDEAMFPYLIPGLRAVCDIEAELDDNCIVFSKIYHLKGLVCRKYSISYQDNAEKVIHLTPLNRAFDSFVIDKNMQGHVIGRIVFAFRHF